MKTKTAGKNQSAIIQLPRIHVFNCVTVHANGTTTSTQIHSDGIADPMEWIRKMVCRGNNASQHWDKPVIAAYVFDNATEEMSRFSVDGDKIHAVITSL